MNVHSTIGRNGMLWIANTAFWNTAGPPLRLEFVIKWTHMYAPTGTRPLREWRRRIRKSCFFRNPESEKFSVGAEGGAAFILG